MHIYSENDDKQNFEEEKEFKPVFHRNKRTQVFLGVVLMFIGGLLIADMMNIVNWNFRYYIFSWQTLLIVLGLVFIANGESRGTGFILLLIGSFFMLPRIFDVPHYWNSLFWPSLLIVIGLVFIFGGNRNCCTSGNRPPRGKGFRDHRGRHFTSSENSDDYIDDVAIFGGGDKVVTSQNFKGGKMTGIFGGSKIDFSRAQLAPGDNTLEVTFIFGGTKLIVPDTWNVKLDVTSVFGGFSDKRVRSIVVADKESRLRITGVCIFGGGEMANYL